MADKKREQEQIDVGQLALVPPRMTVLGDQPLRASEAHLDSLALSAKMGPIYDILRHPDTQTPLSIAIYGDWGTGKTSAMKWLEGLLHKWNADGDHGPAGQRGKVVRPVWFYPWKYHHKEDVWRGLISEVIIASISVHGATLGRIQKAVKEFGLFLGRSFLHALVSLDLVPKTNAQALANIYDEYQRVAHPEMGYLNEFENTLSKWVKDTISKVDERMVIFIDDLDRCMPEVALQVLEALKLYLNVPDLIFVVGVDRSVIDQLLRRLYAQLGLEQRKSRHYLAKMFQVEVVVAPTESQAETFLDEQLAAIGDHTNQYWTVNLNDEERRMFRGVVLRLAQRNPRELKRLLNSALLHGAGVLHVTNQPFSFAQGMQVFLVRRILDERYTMGLIVDTTAGMSFFHRWSQLIRAGAPPTVERPDELATLLASSAGPDADNDANLGRETAAVAEVLAEARINPYSEILAEQRFAHLHRLLADTDLGELMQVEYPADTSALAESSRRELPQGLIREALAREHNKLPVELTSEDYARITHLDLEGLEIADVAPLQSFGELQELVLSFTQVTNIVPLHSLTRLRLLSFNNTRVADLRPIERMASLESLSLANTKVTDLSPLRGLHRLERLNLRGVNVVDISPLSHLSLLSSLSLANTPVSDITPLRTLTQLRSLSLVGVPITDINPLEALEALQSLHLSATPITDATPLAALKDLNSLSLGSTQITDLMPLHGLTRLRFLDLRNTPVTTAAIRDLERTLPKLEVRR